MYRNEKLTEIMVMLPSRIVYWLTSVTWSNTDIERILLEAKHRWLRPAEICEILKNYDKFSIASEPANMPPSMFS